jgi:hypothetical protein
MTDTYQLAPAETCGCRTCPGPVSEPATDAVGAVPAGRPELILVPQPDLEGDARR